ncbi:hypothetical protein OKW30_002448 [Paraburkholderia sp. Clong3]|uniref:hypothetical protein n=1 Tax=Paraburkholderia sp. Clong3 TaxID=2991061 RepID=UPI003D24E2F7
MSKKSETSGKSGTNESTAATLAALANYISEFVVNGTLDSRCAAKLVKRLRKEAETILENGSATKLPQKDLKKAFDTVDAAVQDHDAKLLVTANAALRTADEGKKAEKSH